jgi:hypothetical protein
MPRLLQFGQIADLPSLMGGRARIWVVSSMVLPQFIHNRTPLFRKRTAYSNFWLVSIKKLKRRITDVFESTREASSGQCEPLWIHVDNKQLASSS